MAEGVPGFSLSEGNGDDDMIATKGLSNRTVLQFPSAAVNRGLIRWANSRRDGVERRPCRTECDMRDGNDIDE